MTQSVKQRFIIAGLGNRGRDAFARGLLAFKNRGLPEFRRKSEIAAFVDINRERAKVANRLLDTSFPVYATLPEAASRHMADWAIVTTTDCTHAELAEQALDHGLHVFVDKPLATSVWECRRIIRAGGKNQRRIIVGHNLRYDEYMLTLAKIIRSGRIGEVMQVESGEVLDLKHGGSYFHRWHSEFDKSAGLMNHKCCHQLDIINWALNDEPVGVAALGDLSYYVPRPDLKHGQRCTECPIAVECPHFCDVDAHDQRLRRMYLDVEHVDGYIRDRCVYSKRNTVNDREVLNIRYSKGTTASFSLIAFAPREYSYYYFTGSEGRLEYRVDFQDAAAQAAANDLAESGMIAQPGEPSIKLLHKDGTVETINVEKMHDGYGHGGADVKLIGSLLGVEVPGTEALSGTPPEQAMNAVAIADMAARSIAAGGRYVSIDETGRDFPPAPPHATRED